MVVAGCGGEPEETAAGADTEAACDELVESESPAALAGDLTGRVAQGPARSNSQAADVHARAVPASSPVRQTAKATTITFVAAIYNPTTQQYWTDLVKAFEAENPDITVKVQMIDWNNIGQQVATMVSTQQYPDVLNIDSFSAYAEQDLLYPADEVLSQDVLDDFIPSFKEDGVLDGTHYGMSFIGSTRAFFYNETILEDAGVSEPPKTWAEFVDAAKKVKESGKIGYGLPLGAEDAHGEFSMWMWGNGGEWMTDGEYTIDSQQNIQTMSFLNCLANVYKVTEPNPGKTTRSEVFEQFGQGQIGMVTGASFLPTVLKGAGSTIDYGVSTVPTHGAEPSTLGVQDYLMAFKKDGNKEAVSKFLNFFYEEENYLRFCEDEGFLPVTESGIEALEDDPDFAPFLDLLGDARFYPQTDPAWTKTVGALKNGLGTAVQGEDPAEVLETLQQTAAAGG